MPRLLSSRRLSALVSTAVLLLVAGCDSADTLTPATCAVAPLVAEDLVVGTGQPVSQGRTVSVRYVGRLADGSVFDSTGTAPATLTLGDRVIDGFRLGIGGTAAIPTAQVPEIAPMRLGGRRVLTVPPSLGYGGFDLRDRAGNAVLNEAGTPLIPACSTLIFDVTLVDA